MENPLDRYQREAVFRRGKFTHRVHDQHQHHGLDLDHDRDLDHDQDHD